MAEGSFLTAPRAPVPHPILPTPSFTGNQGAGRKPKPPPPDLPKYSWRTIGPPGASQRTLHYITDVESATYFIGQLKGRDVGFDAEWKPNWVKGAPENPVSLVQLADNSAVLLIHISAMGWKVPRALKTFLEDGTISKLGVGIRGDAEKIWRDHRIVMAGCIDLSQMAFTLDRDRWAEHRGTNISLARLTETYAQHFLEKPKKLQRGNWEQSLSVEMQEYAANDAASGLSIYLTLDELRRSLLGPPSSSGMIDKVKWLPPSGPTSKFKYREKAPSIDSGVDSSSETAVLTATTTDGTVRDSDSPKPLSPSDTPQTKPRPLPSKHEQRLDTVTADLTLLDYRLEKAGSPTPNTGSKRFQSRKRAKTIEAEGPHVPIASPLSFSTTTSAPRNQPRRPNKKTKA